MGCKRNWCKTKVKNVLEPLATRQTDKETRRKCVFAGVTCVSSLPLLPTDTIAPTTGWMDGMFCPQVARKKPHDFNCGIVHIHPSLRRTAEPQLSMDSSANKLHAKTKSSICKRLTEVAFIRNVLITGFSQCTTCFGNFQLYSLTSPTILTLSMWFKASFWTMPATLV